MRRQHAITRRHVADVPPNAACTSEKLPNLTESYHLLSDHQHLFLMYEEEQVLAAPRVANHGFALYIEFDAERIPLFLPHRADVHA